MPPCECSHVAQRRQLWVVTCGCAERATAVAQSVHAELTLRVPIMRSEGAAPTVAGAPLFQLDEEIPAP